jgi:uncharacterized protein involved in outer membrane biogenesis
MNEQPSPQAPRKRWRWILWVPAIVVFSTALAAFVILSRIDFNRLKPILTQVVKEETGRDLEVRGAIDLKLGFRPCLVMDDISFHNPPWASRTEMVKVKRLEAEIMLVPLLRGEVHIMRLVLVEPDVLFETDQSGKWNFEFEKQEASPQNDVASQSFTLPRVAFRLLEVKKGKVSCRKGAKERVHSVAIGRFTAQSEGIESPVLLAFHGSYRGEPFELRGTVGSLLLLKEQGEGYPMDLVLETSSAQLRVEGTVSDMLNLRGLALKLSADVQSSTRVAAFLGETLTTELGPLQTTVAISDAGDKTYKLSDLRISSGLGDAGGSLTVSLGGRRPKLSGVLSSQRVNLAPFLNGKNAKAAETEKVAGRKRIFPDDPLPLRILKSADIQLKVDAGRVQWPYPPLTNLSMEVSVHNGRLVLRPIKMKVAGGDAEGQVEIHPQGRTANAKAVFKLNGADLRLLAPDTGVQGRLDVELDLLSRGSSVASLMAALNGTTVAVIAQGTVDNQNIQHLAGDVASGIVQLLNPSSRRANHTAINCGVSGFDIHNGLATVTALVVETPDMTVMGEGEVNLRDETLDLSLKPYPKGGAAGWNLSFTELANSLKLGGTLADPSLQVNPEQTIFAVLKAAGGVLLFGPAGIVAAFAGHSSCGDNPCLTALESARKGLGGSEGGKGVEQKGPKEKGFSGTLKNVGESVKKFFREQRAQPRVDTAADPYRTGGP